MNKTCEKCIHHDVCRKPLEYSADPETCWKYEEPRPHGEWKQVTEPDIWGKTKYQCSVCNYIHRHSEFVTISFCENCGADMREGDSDA